MKTTFKAAVTGILAVLLLGMVFVSKASAQCASPGLKMGAMLYGSLEGTNQLRQASFVLTDDREDSDDGIVGFWRVKFVSEGSAGIPDGTVVDNGFVQWHRDGTEIMNSSRVPATGNFCLGVWQRSGPSKYSLNHFALSFDASGNMIGPAQIKEHVTLDHAANQYTGTFTIDQFDTTGKLLAHLAGKITGTRVTVNTTVEDVL